MAMIKVTRFNGEEFWINPHLIEFMEETPDTVISLVTGKKVVVKERAAEVTERIIAYRRKLGEGGREWVPTENRGEE
ncbi:MAG TPA: flagellar FlbD family protein [Capillibacterium sp.]